MSAPGGLQGDLLAARGLVAGYGAVPVVRGVDIAVAPGQVAVLLGPNGAGKSTTIMTLAGVLPGLGGEVVFAGDVTSAPLHRRAAAGLGLVTEDRAVLMQLTVAENLRVGRGDVDAAMKLFPELEEHLDRKVGMLSGGQQQMLALARALSRSPRALLADELSLGLAPLIVDRLLKAVRAAADGGLGVLLVEQHIHKALAVADHVYVMQRGEIVLSGSANDLRSRVDEIQATYFSSGGADGAAAEPGPGSAAGT